MKAGIIAAGLGERFQAAGITTPKPLIEVGGRPLIVHAIEAAKGAGASRIGCIVNAETDRVRLFLENGRFGIPIDVVQLTTASSAESFFALRRFLSDGPFLLLTVDALIAPGALAGLVASGERLTDAAGVLAVTTTVDDEKPLWVELDANDRIRSFGDARRSRHVTAGVYFLKPVVYSLADASPVRQWTAFRMFLHALLEHAHPLYGYDVGMAIDVDRPEDIAAAERFLGLEGPS